MHNKLQMFQYLRGKIRRTFKAINKCKGKKSFKRTDCSNWRDNVITIYW